MNLPQDHVVDPEHLFTGVDLNSGMPVLLCCACVVESQKYSLTLFAVNRWPSLSDGSAVKLFRFLRIISFAAPGFRTHPILPCNQFTCYVP